MSAPLKLWRNARLATCDAAARIIEDGALLTRGGRIEWVGPRSRVHPHRRRRRCMTWVAPG